MKKISEQMETDADTEEKAYPAWAKVITIIVPFIVAVLVVLLMMTFVRKFRDYTATKKQTVVFIENPDAENSVPKTYVVTSHGTEDTDSDDDGSTDTVTIEKKTYDYTAMRDTQASDPMGSQTVGYLSVTGTSISYPVMWSEDENYFLTHASDGTSNSNGAIFLATACDPDFSYGANYIFGHNITTGIMFRDLNNYVNNDGTPNTAYLSSHNTAYMVLPDETETYYIFWAEIIDPDADEYYSTGTREDIAARSGVAIPDGAKLIILSTCKTGQRSKRTVVYGYKV